MNGFSKAFLVGTSVMSLGITQPVFPQEKQKDTGGVPNEIAMPSRGALFQTIAGEGVSVLKTFDNRTGIELKVIGLVASGSLITINYETKRGVGTGFAVIFAKYDPAKTMAYDSTNVIGFVKGNGGKITRYSDQFSRKQAEGIYATALDLAIIRFENAAKFGRRMKTNSNTPDLSKSEIDEIYNIMLTERNVCRPILNRIYKEDKQKARPQKFEIPRKGAEPLYNSANYRESVRNIQTAMKAKEIRKPGAQKPFRVRNQLMAKA